MGEVGRPKGRTYSEQVAVVVTNEMADWLRQTAIREQRSVGSWIRLLIEREMANQFAAALVAEDEAQDARELVR